MYDKSPRPFFKRAPLIPTCTTILRIIHGKSAQKAPTLRSVMLIENEPLFGSELCD